jgi:hypothetical protein
MQFKGIALDEELVTPTIYASSVKYPAFRNANLKVVSLPSSARWSDLMTHFFIVHIEKSRPAD